MIKNALLYVDFKINNYFTAHNTRPLRKSWTERFEEGRRLRARKRNAANVLIMTRIVRVLRFAVVFRKTVSRSTFSVHPPRLLDSRCNSSNNAI